MTQTTLLDIAILNNSDKEVGLIEEVIPFVPEVQLVPARTIAGLNFKTNVRVELPTVGFRDGNQGTATSVSRFENRLVECFIMNPIWRCDVAVADAYEDGPEAFIAMEAVGISKAAFITLGKQFYYGRGTGGDAKGHPGLLASVDSSMVVDADGSTANTGSSVWAVTYGPQAVQWVFGNNGQLVVSEPTKQLAYDADDNPYTAYVQDLMARPGLQVNNKYAVGRIKKLTADSGKTLDDDMIADLLSRFPTGHKPDVLFMSRRSQKQLQQSRTATNSTGAPAPFPVEAFGVPIQITDSILDTESLSL